MKRNNHLIYFYSFLLAFCSLNYELVFAQILSVSIGGTKTQYLITISLFTSALGLGSIIFGQFKERFDLKKIFFNMEMLLIILGISGPFVITWLLQASPSVSEWMTIKYILSYFFVFLIGFLSGFEIPCLFSLDDQNHGKILAFDYVGMLMASLYFPLFALPRLGTAGVFLTTAALNQFALVWIKPFENKHVQKLFHSLIVLEILLLFLYRSFFNQLLSSIYLKGI